MRKTVDRNLQSDQEVRQFRTHLRGVSRTLAALTRMLQESIGIPTTEMHLLVYLLENSESEDGDASAADLCEALCLDKGAMSRALAGLERRGLIAREVSPGDLRRQTVTLTEKGRVFSRLIDQEAQQLDGKFLANMNEVKRRRMLAGLAQLHEFYQQHGDELFAECEALATRIRQRMNADFPED